MSSSPKRDVEFFKIVRAGTEPVSPDTYHALYTAAASMVLRSELTCYYSSPTIAGIKSNQMTDEYSVLEEQGATAFIDNGKRLVGADIFTDASIKKRLYGVEADVAVAPETGAAPQPLFELSTDGSLYWVTECETLRAANPEEMRLVLEGLEAVE